jgi:N-succinyldiaminopimelate aminotransferase
LNPRLAKLQTYPFERLRALLAGVTPNPALRPIDLSIGEPKHPTPALVKDALAGALDGLSAYPRTAGLPELRAAMAAWARRRYSLAALDPETQILPVNGSREALFSFVQTAINPGAAAKVVCPNPFYQIYEGAALLAGATPLFLNDGMRFNQIDWNGVQLAFACSPGNPTGRVLTLEQWRELFDLSDRHGFAIASDECYSEIYCDEAKPPLGALEAAARLGRGDFRRLVMFSSLSKRSNAPGMRSGFVAGDAALIKPYLPRFGDEPFGAARFHGGVERRSARAREPAPVRGEIFGRPAPDSGAAEDGKTRGRVLPVAPHARGRRRIRARFAA